MCLNDSFRAGWFDSGFKKHEAGNDKRRLKDVLLTDLLLGEVAVAITVINRSYAYNESFNLNIKNEYLSFSIIINNEEL